jgi:ankyrin repeat protein
LEFGADVHAKDSVGKTALHHAAETSEGIISDHKKMGATFRRLIAAGITINAMDNDGKTALFYAVQVDCSVIIASNKSSQFKSQKSIYNSISPCLTLKSH